MFQIYEAPAEGQHTAERVARLREVMERAGVDAFLVPHADEYMNEYVPPCGQRLAWLTGFMGSAGIAVVARKSAALFVDGRYILQAPEQVDTGLFEILQSPAAKPAEWLGKHLKTGAVVGFDPWLHAPAAVEDLEKELEGKRIKLKALAKNPVDRVWGRQRPAPPQGTVVLHPLKYAGKSAEDKLKDLQALLKREGQDAAVLTFPDSICWLFNIRGADVAHNPIVLAFAIVPASGKPELFVDPVKIDPEAKAYLATLAKLSAPVALERRLGALKQAGSVVRISPAAPLWFMRRLKGGKVRMVRATDPCLLPKARKNATEIKGTRTAHKRDGAAMARFLAWLDREAETDRLDEIAVAQKLETMRSETQALKEISFDTISGAGPNGAIVHYRVTTATNRKLRSGELYLVDSGAQYLDGTTDVTRTVAIGKPTQEMQERFTLVLKGHIAIATARFPKGTRGIELDPFARRALWEAGLDFDHGTGHGVGSYLSVHEGPQSISKGGMVALEPGMIVSNEPGYYKAGAYGIRIENLVLVNEPEMAAGGERETMGFETLTLVPIDRRLVVAEMLSAAELDWLNAYHRRVRGIIGPELGPQDRAWLEEATAMIRPPIVIPQIAQRTSASK
ncbi:MAG: aminopeptidase P family protein [Hyphomonadaceae bacterium]|jgi:Xaa-Pro aminopeptidase|nr:aminopeptidase P family protein [Hyphomonadaceae bacterium]